MQLTSPFRMRSRWIQGACQTWFTTTAWRFNFAYLLAECTDIVTFALAAWKLRDVRTMGVGKVLFQQSVIYIGISTALNTICLVLIYLDLSPVLSYLCSPFAMTISGILGESGDEAYESGAHATTTDSALTVLTTSMPLVPRFATRWPTKQSRAVLCQV